MCRDIMINCIKKFCKCLGWHNRLQAFVCWSGPQLCTCTFVLTGLHSMPACCWATRCTRARQRQTSSKRSVTWKNTWASPENVSGRILVFSSSPSKQGSENQDIMPPQFCVLGTPWKLWKLPKEQSTYLMACWGSAWRSAIWTKPCTLLVTTWCGQERRAFSPKSTNRNGVRDPLGGSFSWLIFCLQSWLQIET